MNYTPLDQDNMETQRQGTQRRMKWNGVWRREDSVEDGNLDNVDLHGGQYTRTPQHHNGVKTIIKKTNPPFFFIYVH